MFILNYKRPIFLSICVFFIMSITGCGNNPSASISLEDRITQRGYIIQEPVKRLKDYRINGWSSVDQRNVILNIGASENYLVTVRSICTGLISAEHLAFSTTVGDLTDKDKLIVRDSGGHIQSCFIDTIHKLEKIKHAGSR